MYVYKQTESDPSLYTVGFYEPGGMWVAESDHTHASEAALRVAWLNGSGDTDLIERVERFLSDLTSSETIKGIFAHDREADEAAADAADARRY